MGYWGPLGGHWEDTRVQWVDTGRILGVLESTGMILGGYWVYWEDTGGNWADIGRHW